ncbi:hypothetical protein OCK74_27255 [Chitinophagaceae bacterium LB-8]|uniref:Uncharacterized protein n=1 Tax=Paraflavisolibacter caeni TaxID=2982496 RepID=A0A9X3BJH1_9BACT|nr:hypothetical protein [Paraflavisolibacter caeni]
MAIRLLKGLPPVETTSTGDDLNPDVKIVIINNTDTLASFYESWNAWGNDAVMLELQMNDTVYKLHRVNDCWLNKNFPSAVMLFPGDSVMFYFKIVGCTPKSSCACFYSLPRGLRFPTNNLASAQLRAYYQLNLENHLTNLDDQLTMPKEMGDVSIIYPKSHYKKFRKLTVLQKMRSFVCDLLISDWVNIQFDKW